MTKNRDFKHLTTANPYPHLVDSLHDSVRHVGGQQGDLAAARNLCVNAGVDGPDGSMLSEAMAFGLAGGVGFLYGVFEYGDTPTLTIVNRNKSMPDPFCAPLFDRLGLDVVATETGGAKTAAKQLDTAIATGTPALCTTGSGFLPYLGLVCEAEEAAAPHLIGVVGADGDGNVLVDDRSPVPLVVARDDVDAARAANRKAKHRMVTVSRPDGHEVDWATTAAEAITAGVVGFNTPPVPQFKANIGLAGLAKWHDLLTSGTKKGWGTVFGDGRRAAIGFTRLYDCIHHAYTSPSAGRPLYADFLDEAAGTGHPDAAKWRQSADLWRASGQRWSDIATRVAAVSPAIARCCEVSDLRAADLDTGSPSPDIMRDATTEKAELIDSCDVSAVDAAEAHGDIAAMVVDIVQLETEALDLLS